MYLLTVEAKGCVPAPGRAALRLRRGAFQRREPIAGAGRWTFAALASSGAGAVSGGVARYASTWCGVAFSSARSSCETFRRRRDASRRPR